MSRAAPVDVLAVMDAACCVLAIDKCADPQKKLEQARAAIAELIACAQRSAEILERVDDPAACGNAQRLRAALARVGSAGGAP